MCTIYIHRAFCNHGHGTGDMESPLYYSILYKGAFRDFGMVVVGRGGGGQVWFWNQSLMSTEG